MSVVIGWRWSASYDGLVCAFCLAQADGSIHPVDEELVSHPNCFVGDTVVSGSRALASSARWYTGEIVDIETIDGNRFTVTPNHPILTTKGWVSAGLLNESHYVIRCLDSEGMHHFINPNDYEVPATIKEVAESLHGSPDMSTIAMPVAAEDFHNDGKGSEVAIICADGNLWNCLKPSAQKKIGGFLFRVRDSQLQPLSSLGGALQLANTAGASLDRIMSRLNVSDALLLAASRHVEAIRSGIVPDGYTLSYEAGSDRLAINTVSLSENILGFPTCVSAGDFLVGQSLLSAASSGHLRGADLVPFRDTTPEFALYECILEACGTDMVTRGSYIASLAKFIIPERVLKINRRAFSGHVYNLQTRTGFYVANNIIAHNCRCAKAPVTRSWADLGIGDGDDEPFQTGEEWLRQQDQATQERILGKAGRAAWLDGRFELKDVIGTKEDDLLGEIGYRKSLIEILGEELADYYKRRVA